MARPEARCFMDEYLFVNPVATCLFKDFLYRADQRRLKGPAGRRRFKEHPRCSAIKANSEKRSVGKRPIPSLSRRPTVANKGKITSLQSEFAAVSFHHTGFRRSRSSSGCQRRRRLTRPGRRLHASTRSPAESLGRVQGPKAFRAGSHARSAPSRSVSVVSRAVGWAHRGVAAPRLDAAAST